MKPCFLLSGALLLSVPVFAQGQVPPIVQTTGEPSGYDLLVQAGKAILPGPNGGASASEKLPPEENLKNERLAVARNAPALALVRRALQKPIEMPDDSLETSSIAFNGKVRELARQFLQESDVRVADGNFAGAMNSRLDAMEMGAVTGHGLLISLLVGVAVESIGGKGIDQIAAKLDAAQCREAIVRLNKIEARRTTLTETLRAEQKYALDATLKTFGTPQGLENLEPDKDGGFPTVEDVYGLRALSTETLANNNKRLYNAAIEAAKLPFALGSRVALPQDLDPLTKLSLTILENGQYRFRYDVTVAQARLLRAALELRAQKLETGGYPQNFVAPADPFAPNTKPLVYLKTGKDYLLYSVGPDGKDDNGAEIQAVETLQQTGLKKVNDRLLPTSTGDIVQLPF